jgi:V/A-type H+-transporting ATPase subunit E
MVEEINNLDKLLDKVYSEGIQKAKTESSELLAKTKRECESMKKEAQEEVQVLIANARRESSRITQSAENELVLKGKQLINDLKSEVENSLSQAIIETNVSGALADVSFLQTIIKEAIGHWKSSNDIDLMLPDGLKTKIKESFAKSIGKNIDGLNITFSDKLKGGFRISRKEDTYQVSFTEEDFINLFRSYLTELTDKLLFKES